MKGPQLTFITAIILWLAGGFQQAVAPALRIGSVAPDFFIIAIGCLAIFGNRRTGTTMGFLGGLLEGALAGTHMGAYTISRSIAGFVAGWFTSLEFESGLMVAVIVVAASTAVAQLLLMFIAPPGQIPAFLLATMGSAVYNGVLAIPLYAFLRRVVDPPSV